MLYETVLFDLDGTLIESGPGIYAAIDITLEAMGLPKACRAQLDKMVGPPITVGFRDIIGVPEEMVEEAVALYRKTADEVSLAYTVTYPGVEQMLAALKKEGIKLGIVTSKITDFAVKCLAHCNIAQYFGYVRGGEKGPHGADKLGLLQRAVADMGADKKSVVMVGDRMYDLDAANALGIDCIGVAYGYGSREELAARNPAYIVDDTARLLAVLLKDK